MSSKGSLSSLEIVVLMVVIPVFISAVMVHVLMGELLSLSIVQQYAFPTELAKTVQGYAGFLDGVVLVTFVALGGRIFWKSLQINMHPVFGIVGLIGLSGLAIVGGVASNIVGVFTNLSIVGTAANAFPGSFALLTNLPAVFSVFGLLILIVMVGVSRGRS